MTDTRVFSKLDIAVMQRLAKVSQSEIISLSQWLGKIYFTETSGRALMHQLGGRYTVLYLRPEVFYDEPKKQTEIIRLLELCSLFRYLADKGYIYLFQAECPISTTVLCSHNAFDQIHRAGNLLVLNARKDYSMSPKSVLNKHDNIIYEGIIFTAEYHETMVRNLTGKMYVSHALRYLLKFLEERQMKENAVRKKASWKRWNSRPMLIVALLLFITLAGIAYFYWSASASPENTIDSHDGDPLKTIHHPAPRAFYGIDVSLYNGNLLEEIDQQDSISFTIFKATEGMHMVDPQLSQNWTLAQSKKMLWGAYHFYKACEDPHIQANHFWGEVRKLGIPDLAVAVDVEQSSLPQDRTLPVYDLREHLLKMLRELEMISGLTPYIYTDISFANQYLDAEFAHYPLWLADYSKLPQPEVPVAWREAGVKIWQRSNHYTINSSSVDLDIFYPDSRDSLILKN